MKKNKKLVRLTEADLHNIVKNSVNKIISESIDRSPMKDEYFAIMDELDSEEMLKLLVDFFGVDDIIIQLAHRYSNENLERFCDYVKRMQQEGGV